MKRGLVQTSKGQLHYREHGSGECVMLFHINQQSSAMYLELMQELGTNYRAIAIDYPSYGMSDHVDWKPTMDDYADLMVEVLDELGIEKTHVMGEAVGAMVATALAARHPSRVGKAILLNCPYAPVEERKNEPGGVDDSMRPADETGFPKTRTIEFVLKNDPLHAPMNPTQSWMDRINEAQILAGRDRWQAYNAIWGFDFDARLQAMSCPVMIVMGENFYFLRNKDALIKQVKDVKFKVMPGGRFGMGWEFAQELGVDAKAFFG